MSTPDKCPHCGSRRAPGLRFTFDCGSAIYPNGDEFRSDPCEVAVQVRASERAAHAATKAELERLKDEFSAFIASAQESCKGCHGAGQDNDGEGYTGEPCPDCRWIAQALPQRMSAKAEPTPPDSRLFYGLDWWDSGLCESVEELVKRYSEDTLVKPRWPITVYEFKLMDLPKAESLLVEVLEALDQDYQTEYETEPTPRMLAGMQMILADYRVGACEETGVQIVVTAEDAAKMKVGKP